MIGYDPRVFLAPDGSQVLVSLYWDDDGKLLGVDAATRPDPYATWGPPLKDVTP